MSQARLSAARELYAAFAAADRTTAEGLLAPDFTFSSPHDVGLGRDGFFTRCWPGAGGGQQFDFVRLIAAGDEVIVTYERVRADGGRGRNTEVLSFDGEDRIRGAEVYFGWDVPAEATPTPSG